MRSVLSEGRARRRVAWDVLEWWLLVAGAVVVLWALIALIALYVWGLL